MCHGGWQCFTLTGLDNRTHLVSSPYAGADDRGRRHVVFPPGPHRVSFILVLIKKHFR